MKACTVKFVCAAQLTRIAMTVQWYVAHVKYFYFTIWNRTNPMLKNKHWHLQQEPALALKSLWNSELYETILLMKMNSFKYCAFGDMSLPNSQQSWEDASHTINGKKKNQTQNKTITEATPIRDISPAPYPPLQNTLIKLPLSLVSRFSLKETLVFKLIAVITFQCTVTEVSGSTKLANVMFGKMSLLVSWIHRGVPEVSEHCVHLSSQAVKRNAGIVKGSKGAHSSVFTKAQEPHLSGLDNKSH